MTVDKGHREKPIQGLGREAEELKTLWEISQSLYEFLDIDDLIFHIIKRIREEISAEGVSVILHDEELDEFVFRWAELEPSESLRSLKETRFPAHQGIAGRVFQSGKPALINDIGKEPGHYKRIDSITGYHTKSLIAVPLQKRDRRIGVLEIINKIGGRFSQRDLAFISTLAPIISMALDNARMFTELGHSYNELRMIDQAKDELIRDAEAENARLRDEIERRFRFDRVIGHSDCMLELFRLCERAIDSDIPVLIEGETGTGKELIARCIHFNGPRKARPFVVQNCGGIQETLLASELFGHTRGAFTGAVKDKRGLFDIADGGTLLLDEVAEMSPAMQTSLLRVLQEGEIKPLGADYSKKVDVRVLSATNKNLEEAVSRGQFREDLLYRLNAFGIKLPPLRERREDIPILVNHFLERFGKEKSKTINGISREALRSLMANEFRGNVRELENEIRRAIAMAEDAKQIENRHLSAKIRDGSNPPHSRPKTKESLKEMVESFEISIVLRTMEKHQGNKSRAARELGLSRYGLMKKIQRYGL